MDVRLLLAQVDWVSVLQTFGLAVTIIFFIGVALWRFGKWFGAEIVVPVRDKLLMRLIAFLDSIETTVKKVDINVDSVTGNLGQQTAALQSLQETNVGIKEGTERVADSLEKEHNNLRSLIEQAVEGGKARHAELLAEFKKLEAQQLQIMAKLEKIEPAHEPKVP